MPGQGICFLLALTVVHRSADTFSSCNIERHKLHEDICPTYSCRLKCNNTVEFLREGGTQQMCYCDELCVLLDDCCVDFTGECPDVNQGGLKKYPNFESKCYGDMRIITGLSKRKQHAMAAISKEIIKINSTLQTSKSETKQPQMPLTQWTYLLNELSLLKVDETKGIILSPSFHGVEDYNMPYSTNLTLLKRIRIILEVKQPITDDVGYFDSRNDIQIHTVDIPRRQQQLKRKCFEKRQFQCPSCSSSESPESLCSEKYVFKLFAFARVSTAPCAALNQTTQRGRTSFTEALVVSGQENKSSIILLPDLPWSILRCQFATCRVESCRHGRVLSVNGRACFIPGRVKILFHFVPSKQDQETTIQNNSIKKNVTRSFSLCLSLYYLLQGHQYWTFYGILPHQECIFRFRFKAFTNAKENQESQKRWNVSLMENLNLHTYPTVISKYDNSGMEQAWDLIHNNLDTLPDANNLLRLKICLESKHRQNCLPGEESDSCGERVSRCVEYEVSAAKTYVSNLMQRLGICCMSYILALLLTA